MFLSRIKIVGHSMSPKYKNNDYALVSSIPYFFSNPSIDDIVVFEHSGQIYIKRIKEIKNEKYFLVGDNKEDSLDSRKFGMIKKEKIKGKVIIKI